MNNLPPCPKCHSEFVYQDQSLLVCPECAHEWVLQAAESVESDEVQAHVVDAFGVVLRDGDSVVVIKDLKIKGASSTLKVGTKIKNIRIVDGDHNLDCKIAGIGAMGLKSEFVKKATD